MVSVIRARGSADGSAGDSADHRAGHSRDMRSDACPGHTADDPPENAFFPVPAAVGQFHFVQIQFHRIHYPYLLRDALVLLVRRGLIAPCTCRYAPGGGAGSGLRSFLFFRTIAAIRFPSFVYTDVNAINDRLKAKKGY